MKTWLLVPCQGERAAILQRFLESVRHPPERTVVVTTNADPVGHGPWYHWRLVLPWTGHHISRWWNAGLEFIDDAETEPHVIVAASSDTVGNDYSIPQLAGTLAAQGWVMAGPNWHDGKTTYELPEERSVIERVPGACWAIVGGRGYRLDEDFRWWYSDDDFEMQLREVGRVGLVGQTGLIQGEPDSYMTEQQAKHADEDRARFVKKWGKEPW